MKITIHLHPVPRRRICGATPVLPVFVSVVWTGTTLFCYNFCIRVVECEVGQSDVMKDIV
jgi:hypothetical protein